MRAALYRDPLLHFLPSPRQVTDVTESFEMSQASQPPEKPLVELTRLDDFCRPKQIQGRNAYADALRPELLLPLNEKMAQRPQIPPPRHRDFSLPISRWRY
jgi:hypothetical protein